MDKKSEITVVCFVLKLIIDFYQDVNFKKRSTTIRVVPEIKYPMHFVLY